MREKFVDVIPVSVQMPKWGNKSHHLDESSNSKRGRDTVCADNANEEALAMKLTQKRRNYMTFRGRIVIHFLLVCAFGWRSVWWDSEADDPNNAGVFYFFWCEAVRGREPIRSRSNRTIDAEFCLTEWRAVGGNRFKGYMGRTPPPPKKMRTAGGVNVVSTFLFCLY